MNRHNYLSASILVAAAIVFLFGMLMQSKGVTIAKPFVLIGFYTQIVCSVWLLFDLKKYYRRA